MKVLSHRGHWTLAEQGNTEFAFSQSFIRGFGVETDIRDMLGELVISHDMPIGKPFKFEDFLDLAMKCNHEQDITLALNIKADGLADLISSTLSRYSQIDYFAFDMSIPDMLSYIRCGVPVFSRMSEFERVPAFIERSSGVWLDGFYSDWYDTALIEDLLHLNKRVCIVSPELHGRPYFSLWEKLRTIDHAQLMICTDYSENANLYFNLENEKK